MSVYGKPVSVYGKPVSVYGKPVSVYGKPVSVYGKPVSVYGKPVSVYGKPCVCKPVSVLRLLTVMCIFAAVHIDCKNVMFCVVSVRQRQ